MSNKFGAALSADGKRVICNFGERVLRPGESMEEGAQRLYDAWNAGVLPGQNGYTFWLGAEADY